MIDEQMRLTGSIGAADAEFWGASREVLRNALRPPVASPQDIEDMRRETVRDAERMAGLLNAMKQRPQTDRAFRRAQPYRRARAYFSRLEQLARDGRIG